MVERPLKLVSLVTQIQKKDKKTEQNLLLDIYKKEVHLKVII